MIAQLLPSGTSETLIRLLLALLAVFVIYLLRKLVTRLFAWVLGRLTHRPSDKTLYDVVVVPAQLLRLALAINVVAYILLIQGDAWAFIFRLTRTLVIMALFIVSYQLVGQVMSSRARLYSVTRLSVEDALLPFFRTSLRFILIAIVTVIIVQLWGYDVSGLLTGLGLGGLAVSLAAQDTLSNLFGFSMIIGDRPFTVGDYIVTPDVEGSVERVGLRSTRIRRNDQAVVTVPNNRLANSNVLNWSRLSKRWIDFRLPIALNTTAEQIEELMQRIRAMMAEREQLDRDTIEAHLIDFNANGLIIMVRTYVLLADWLQFAQEREEIYLNILRIVQTMKLDVAFPGQSVYIREAPDLSQNVQAGLHLFDMNRQPVDAPPAKDHHGEQSQ